MASVDRARGVGPHWGLGGMSRREWKELVMGVCSVCDRELGLVGSDAPRHGSVDGGECVGSRMTLWDRDALALWRKSDPSDWDL